MLGFSDTRCQSLADRSRANSESFMPRPLAVGCMRLLGLSHMTRGATVTTLDPTFAKQQPEHTVGQIVLLPSSVVATETQQARRIRIRDAVRIRLRKVDNRGLQKLQTKLSALDGALRNDDVLSFLSADTGGDYRTRKKAPVSSVPKAEINSASRQRACTSVRSSTKMSMRGRSPESMISLIRAYLRVRSGVTRWSYARLPVPLPT